MGNKKTRAEPEPAATSTQVTRGSGSEVRFYSAGAAQGKTPTYTEAGVQVDKNKDSKMRAKVVILKSSSIFQGSGKWWGEDRIRRCEWKGVNWGGGGGRNLLGGLVEGKKAQGQAKRDGGSCELAMRWADGVG